MALALPPKASSLLALALLLGLSAAPEAQTTLAPGDLVVTGLVADGNESFALLATVDIETGTVFTITDKGVNAAGEIQPNRESYREFTTTAPISAGDTFIASEDATPFYPDALGTPTRGSSFISFSTSGDQVLIFQGEETNPTFIFLYSSTPFDQDFVNTEDDGTDPGNDPVNQSGTALPPGLVNGVSAIDFDPHVDNAEYDRANGTTGTRAEILALVGNEANYTTSNDRFDLTGGSFTITASGGGDPALLITGIIDGPLAGGTPKAIELYALADIPDLSVYGINRVSNGGGSDGEADYALSGSASAGDYLYAASEGPQFEAFFGFAPTFNDAPIFVNGDDAIELYFDGALVDVVGDPNVDGTDQPWEYTDGWAYRMSGTMASPTFVVTDWTYSGVDALDDETTNATAATPFPTGTYSTTPSMEPQTFTALARGEFEVPEVETGARGGVTATLDGTMLTVTGAFAYLESDYDPAVGAHLHGGASGENGPIRYALTPTLDMDNRGGFFAAADNMFTVRETFADSLRAGLVYFNLHTVDNGSGEIRGQLGMGADALATSLSGDQEVPPVDTDASGEATVTVTGNMVTVEGSVDGLESDYDPNVGSHIHAGARGVNGPIIIGLTPVVAMDMRSLTWAASDNTFEVRSTFADSLRAGLAYLNVHTVDQQAGEIRGQIGFEAEMDVEAMDLADIRAAGVGQEVTFVGVVTRAQGRLTYVQDATAGIAIFQRSGDFFDAVASGAIAMGDSLMVTGTTTEFNGLFQIGTVESFDVISRDNALPEYQSVTLEQIAANGEEYESELIQVRGLMFSEQGAFAASTTYQVGDQSGAVTLRTPSASDTRIAGVDIPQEAAIFRGVLGQFDNEDPRDSGYQLNPVAEMDVVPQGDASGLVINEILYDPADEMAGDANGDGTRNGSDDEFIEIVNSGDGSVDLGGFVIEDGASLDSGDETFVRHRFPVGTVLEPGQGVVVFGGGTPTGEFGSALVQTASNGSLGLNNSGDTVTLAESAITDNAGGAVIATVEYDGSVNDQSIARIPDLTGDFVAHSTNPQNPVLFSPGVSNLTGGGGGFPSASEETPDGTLVLNVANPLRADAQVRFETPASGEVSLVLFDALGRRVAVLSEGDLAAGAHAATLRASALAPGVYVLRLVASGTQLTRTLTVVR